MKFIRPLSMLLLFLAIAACTSGAPQSTFVAKPAAPAPLAQPKPPTPPPTTASSVRIMPMPSAVFDAARADINAGQAAAALAKLEALPPDILEPAQKQQWHSMRASAFALQGGLLDALRERVLVDPLLTDPAMRHSNQEAILQALALLPPEQLNGFPLLAGDPLSGWLSLGRIYAPSNPPEARPALLARWHLDFPAHPASEELLQAHINQQPGAATAVVAPVPTATPAAPVAAAPVSGALAILLPGSGPSAAYGTAVRQGIVAAHEADTTQSKPGLRFYDSENGDVLALYKQALAEGVEAVIGPLHKEQVAALIEIATLPKPVLALNQIDATRESVYQFSLRPEDELEQVADHAFQEGRRNALLLAPAKDIGQRMLSHFSDYWQGLGGQVATMQTYAPGEKDYSGMIKKLLRVGEPSKDKPQAPRADVDAIFLIADPHDARMLVPQLRYYGATRLPIYATAMIYSGHPNRSQDQDLAGVMFCDTPWLLVEDSAAQRQTVLDAGGAAGNNPRLWAMGWDAYRLGRQLDLLQGGYAGASGGLSLKPGNRIHRQLLCVRFTGGLPVAPPPATPEQPAQ